MKKVLVLIVKVLSCLNQLLKFDSRFASRLKKTQPTTKGAIMTRSSADSRGSYGLFMEYSNAGMMRRTEVDFSLHGARGDRVSLTQLGIVAQGLEGLTGSVPDEGEEELDSMVGMASTMLGVKLRPLTFFRGYSEMMSLVWGSSSDNDGAGVEAMLMLMDFLQVRARLFI